MKFIGTPINELFIIELDVFEDERGWFARTYCKREFAAQGIKTEWTQLNHSFTKEKGAIRGLHYQLHPFTESKMVKCVSGSVYDVAVDLRKDSDTFLQWFGIELSEENRKMLYIPAGFAHGFQTLTKNCGLIYHHTSYYEPGYEAGIHYSDPRLNIKWPLHEGTISARDQSLPYLNASFKGL